MVKDFAQNQDVKKVLTDQAELPEQIDKNGEVVVSRDIAERALKECIRIHDAARAKGYHVANWTVFDAKGTLLGRAVSVDRDVQHHVGRRYEWRDYFQGAKETYAPYVSRVYIPEGKQDEAIAVAFAVREGRKFVGALVAKLTTGSALETIEASALESKGTSVSLLALSDCARRPEDSDNPKTITPLQRCQASYLNPVIILRNDLEEGRTADASPELLGENGSPTYTAAVKGTPITVHVHHRPPR
jgi:hypothetical protein